MRIEQVCSVRDIGQSEAVTRPEVAACFWVVAQQGGVNVDIAVLGDWQAEVSGQAGAQQLGMPADNRYAFLVEWLDPQAQLIRQYLLFYYSIDGTVEMVRPRPFR